MIITALIRGWFQTLASEKPTPCGVPDSAALEIFLPKGSLWHPAGKKCPVAINCLSGMLWVTEAGDSRDHILELRDEFAASGVGDVAVQALQDSRFSVSLRR